MAIAPSIDSNGNSSDSQSMVRIFGEDDRLFLVFSEEIDEDMPPLAEDFRVSIQGQFTAISSMDVQIEKGVTALAFFLDDCISEGQEVSIRYLPASWYMCSSETGESFPAFEECVVPLSLAELDAEVRLKTRFNISAKTQKEDNKLPEAKLRAVSEFCLTLAFDATLDSINSLDKDDFRAEHEDRWLRIATLKYVRAQVNADPEIQIELTEAMTPGAMVKLEYRSPENRLKTLSGEPIRPFTVETCVDCVAVKEHLSVVDSASDSTPLPPLSLASVEPAAKDVQKDDDAATEQLFEVLEEDYLQGNAESEQNIAEPEIVESEIPEQAIEEQILEEELEPEANEQLETDAADVAVEVLEQEALTDHETQAPDELDSAEDDSVFDDELVELSDENLLDENEEPLLEEQDEAALAAQDTAAFEEQDTSQEDELTSAEKDAQLDGESNDELNEELNEEQDEALADEDYSLAYAQEVTAISDEVMDQEQAPEAKSKLEQVFSALDARSSPKEKVKTPLSTTAKIVYSIPIVILAWVLIVICIYLATIVFDINFSSSDDLASNATSTERESCRIRSDDGSVYEGECLNGLRDGYGVFTWPSGNYYVGEWVNGEQQGAGKLVYASGAVYEGGFSAGREDGSGRMKWPNGAVYAGKYKNGRFSGQGMYLSAEGNRYVGEFSNGNMTDNGRCIMKSGEQYDGPCRSQGAPKAKPSSQNPAPQNQQGNPQANAGGGQNPNYQGGTVKSRPSTTKGPCMTKYGAGNVDTCNPGTQTVKQR